MKSIPALLLFCIFTLILSSCKKDEITTYYTSGNKHEVYQFKGDSLKHGSYIAYIEKGTVFEKSHYEEGKLNGIREIFRNDTLEIREHYVNDVIDGSYELFYPNGQVRMKAEYKHGVLTGIVKGYYPGGELREEVTFEKNMENGPFTEYHPNGQIMWKGTYLNGDNEFGLLEQFNEEGVLIKKMMCNEEAICTTTWTLEGGDKTE